jgi:hypothetical protein
MIPEYRVRIVFFYSSLFASTVSKQFEIDALMRACGTPLPFGRGRHPEEARLPQCAQRYDVLGRSTENMNIGY